MAEKHRINFISNLDLKETSGGWTGINYQLFLNLSKHFDINYAGPISPRNDYQAKVLSKVNRIVGRRGSFQFFSPRRLDVIASEVSRLVDPAADYDFFHGQTPWIAYESPRAYGAYVDASFPTYLDIYHKRSEFLEDDLKRISDMESRWLGLASNVFFGSQWALRETLHQYSLRSSIGQFVGIAGNTPVPDLDSYSGALKFLFIGLDFERKGGRICVEAFKRVLRDFPSAQLILLGARPPHDVLKVPNVFYGGFLRKTVASELHHFQTLLQSAFALLHPTAMDTMGMVLIEAGYYGCPSIAPRSFGIPELIQDGITGLLMEPPPTVDKLVQSMLLLCRDPDKYRAMRRSSREFTSSSLRWQVVVDRIAAAIYSSIEARRHKRVDLAEVAR